MDPLLRANAARPSEQTTPTKTASKTEAAAFALHALGKRDDTARGLLEPGAVRHEDGLGASDEVELVRFEAVAVSDGRVLAVAHLLRTQVAELYEEADRRRRSRIKRPLPDARADIEVELAAPSAGVGCARITVRGGALGPMTLELRLAGDRVELRAMVCSRQAADALLADRAMLERALLAQGLELETLSVDVARRKEG